MNINKATLLAALEIVKPGLASKEVIAQATSFCFMNGNVITYNDEISISHPVEGLEVEGAVKAEQLYQLLNKIKKDEIDVTVENNEILLKAGKAKAGLVVQAEITLPLDSIATPKKWKLLPDNFIKYLSFAVGSASKDMSRPVLTCVHINQEGFIEASDSLRITKCTMEGMPIRTFLIPATSCVTIIKLEPIKIAEGSGWIHFKTAEGTILSCREYEGDHFPDTTALFKVKGSNITLPKNMQTVLDRASVFSKREHMLDESVSVTLENNNLNIRADSETGWFEEDLNIKYTGEPIKFAVSPYLLRGILSETLSCILSPDRMKFEGENWIYVTTLKI